MMISKGNLEWKIRLPYNVRAGVGLHPFASPNRNRTRWSHGMAKDKLLICHTCGNEYLAWRNHAKTSKFCSRECRQVAHPKVRIEKICTTCGEAFWVTPGIVDRAKYCSKPCKFVGRQGIPLGPRNGSPDVRFWKFVDKTPGYGIGDCWRWTGGIASNGYGKFYPDGRRKIVSAHRYSLMLKIGPFAPLQALHSCDVRDCVNPDHLFPGTQADNMADKVRKGRLRNQHMTKLEDSFRR